MKQEFSGQLKCFIEMAKNGTAKDMDNIMFHLTPQATLAMTRFIDFALSLVENKEGMNRIQFYLFNGTQIQRNYASLFFNRLLDWEPVKKAYEQGLIDEIQAYAR